MLADGEIDLFGNVSYTPERAELFDFSSYPQGKDTYWLYINKNQSSLDSGDVDAIVAPNLATDYDYLAISSIGYSEFYFAVSKDRPDILNELNHALYEIQTNEADYNSKLASRYYYKSASSMPFNDEEKEWLAAHNNTLRLGYLADNLPFSGEEDGKLSGILNTVTDTLEREYGITVETQSYDELMEMKQAMTDHEIDIMGPVISDYYLTEQSRFVLTDSIVETTPVIIYKDDYQNSLQVIAVTDKSLFGPDITGVLFPDAELYVCDTQEDCLKAVANGKAGSTLIPSSRINILNASPLMEGLSFAEMAKQTEIGMLATKENRRAATIFNKGIEQSSELLNGVVLAQHSVADGNITFAQFVKKHSLAFIAVSGVIIFILGALLYHLSVSRKQVLQALEEARNANSANSAKTAFLNNMSHDIRTPMNAIIGFTDIALKNDPTPEVKSHLEKVKQSSDYLLSLINDVLDISRIESGNIAYAPKPVNITAVTDSVLDITHGFLINRDLQLIVHRDEPETHYVMADEVRLREILINIISNSVKFTHDGGKITFETFRKPGTDPENLVFCYRISDTGIGMSKEFASHIFDGFSQENSGARTQYQGTGLGMAITKKYVELMGGTITVESVKGEGSTFTVELPLILSDPIEQEDHYEPAVKKNPTDLHVLMAEDNDLNAEIATMLLEDEGMNVTRAVDGCEVVEMFKNHPAGTFDVILMDIMMPRMNGYEATKTIRELSDRPDGARIPIVAMTANAFAEDVVKCKEAGMDSHLPKPFKADQLIASIVASKN